jgi:hypothetical protein
MRPGNSVIKKVGEPKTKFYLDVVGLVLCLLCTAYMVANYLVLKADAASSWYVSNSTSQALSMLGVLSLVFIAVTALSTVQTVVKHKASLCVCEGVVYGVGVANMYFKSEPFELTYDEILNVKKGSQHSVVIEGKTKTYKCVVADREEMCRLIQERITRR